VIAFVSPSRNSSSAENKEAPATMTTTAHDRIASRAYELFELRGKKDGYDLADWFQAERDARAESRARIDTEDRGVMDELVVGNPKEWQPFAVRHPLLIERLGNLTDALNTIMNRRWTDDERVDTIIFVAGHMAVDDFMEIVTLCGNSEGHGAMKVLRSMFERVVTLRYLHAHPDEFERYYKYYWVSKRKMAHAIENTFQKGLIPKDRMQEIEDNYNKVKDEYKMTLCEKCGTTRPGIAWSPKDMVTMAKEVGMGLQLVSSYYMPLDEAHPNVKGMADRVDIRDGRIIVKERLDRELSDRALIAAHLLTLQALEVQVERFKLDPEPYKRAEQDFLEIWRIPPTAEAVAETQ
jgi:hypothetical protein